MLRLCGTLPKVNESKSFHFRQVGGDGVGGAVGAAADITCQSV